MSFCFRPFVEQVDAVRGGVGGAHSPSELVRVVVVAAAVRVDSVAVVIG